MPVEGGALVSREAWGDEGGGGPDGYVTDERAEEAFVEGAQAAREMLARFVEQGGHPEIATSIRANWHPGWGADPGPVTGKIPISPWGDTE